jgi:hypothetical protein
MVDGSHIKKCLELNLVYDDEQWIKAMRESVTSRDYPHVSRLLFALILIHCAPKDPKAMWSMFKEDLSSDIYRKLMRE